MGFRHKGIPQRNTDGDSKFEKMVTILPQKGFRFFDLHLNPLKVDDILQLKSHLDVVAILNDGLIKSK